MMSETTPRGSIRRSRAILRAAFRALRANPRLAWFPVLSALGTVALAILGGAVIGVGTLVAGDSVAHLGPLWELVADPDPDGDATVTRAMSIAGLVFYVGNTLVMVAMGVAMTHAALEALAGREWTVRQSLRVASQRRRSIATFALIQATVGHLLGVGGGRGRRGGRRSPGLLSQLARFAWWATTYLVLPVIAREGRGGVGAIRRSATLLRQTWKETLVARLTVGWLWIPAVFIGAIPVLACVVLGMRQPAVLLMAIVIPVIGLGMFGLILHTLEKIYRAALYTYATEGVVPEAFATHDLHEIWEVASAPIDVQCDDAASDDAASDDAINDDAARDDAASDD
ncbi:MAG: hypothetical protein K0V04_35950 [Deltaproteobacteria bacterium]|nr:hypothetical protein [Deltaproteobacteria bacterium]